VSVERYTKKNAKLVADALDDIAEMTPARGARLIIKRAAHLLRESAKPARSA
jgi:hypothetical protein